MKQLIDQIGQHTALTIIGMCKNAGKTTALGHILRGLWDDGQVLGLTSIGRDGESVDRVTGTEKPGIFVRRGTLVATAAGLLGGCDITREILATTGFQTPLGEVVVVRALSDGSVDLAGPSMVDQLVALRQMFEGFGAGRVIIDGAISRKTLCSRRLSDATVLSVGASCGRDMGQVVREAAHTCRMLMLPELLDPQLEAALAAHPQARLVLLGRQSDVLAPPAGVELTETVKTQGDTRLVFVDGALSEGLLAPFVRSGAALGDITFVVRDASRIMLGADTWERLEARGCTLAVLESVGLAAVTVNPYSAYGYHFDPDAFLAAMTAAVTVPVYDLGRL